METISRRTDEQLEAVLDEACHWTVNGSEGRVLCSAASLRRAISRTQEYAWSGAVVTAICRQPGDSIIVFEAQMNRLRMTLTERKRAAVAA